MSQQENSQQQLGVFEKASSSQQRPWLMTHRGRETVELISMSEMSALTFDLVSVAFFILFFIQKVKIHNSHLIFLDNESFIQQEDMDSFCEYKCMDESKVAVGIMSKTNVCEVVLNFYKTKQEKKMIVIPVLTLQKSTEERYSSTFYHITNTNLCVFPPLYKCQTPTKHAMLLLSTSFFKISCKLKDEDHLQTPVFNS